MPLALALVHERRAHLAGLADRVVPGVGEEIPDGPAADVALLRDVVVAGLIRGRELRAVRGRPEFEPLHFDDVRATARVVEREPAAGGDADVVGDVERVADRARERVTERVAPGVSFLAAGVRL